MSRRFCVAADEGRARSEFFDSRKVVFGFLGSQSAVVKLANNYGRHKNLRCCREPCQNGRFTREESNYNVRVEQHTTIHQL